ncbi:50S ribosomal protein L18 [bacterium]|nr:50S ribosomal protein L18 [bacterium]
MISVKEKKEKRKKRHKKIRSRISGTAQIPRLCVFRSNRHIYCQLIDDQKGHTIASASDFEVKKASLKGLNKKVAVAYQVGKLIARKAKEKNIKKIVFDRGGFAYHGRVKAVADGAREGGLEF